MAKLIQEEFKLLRDKHWTNENAEKIVLENTTDNHYKYYHLSQDKNENFILSNSRPFRAAWGRIGHKAQSKNYIEPGLTMWDQMMKKLAKGYIVKTYQVFGDHCSAYQEFMQLVGDDAELFD